ncbi:hypothetical protein K438DRAFT_1785043 [Mycena galopus ATCC 62051]|nr:hypothetical protein K438DRAFT_1785043 [Mycena galopus ATCC 62051]
MPLPGFEVLDLNHRSGIAENQLISVLVGVIGGSGLYSLGDLTFVKHVDPETGFPSSPIAISSLPSGALSLGVRTIVAFSAVGSLRAEVGAILKRNAETSRHVAAHVIERLLAASGSAGEAKDAGLLSEEAGCMQFAFMAPPAKHPNAALAYVLPEYFAAFRFGWGINEDKGVWRLGGVNRLQTSDLNLSVVFKASSSLFPAGWFFEGYSSFSCYGAILGLSLCWNHALAWFPSIDGTSPAGFS